MIKCTNCGAEIKDGNKFCINCGADLTEQKATIKFCPYCGQDNFTSSDNKLICEGCGKEISLNNNNGKTDEHQAGLQKVEISSIKIPKISQKKFIVVFVIVAIMIIGSIFGIIIHKKYSISKYSDNLQTATSTMLLGASTAEDAGGLIHDVWYNTIYEKLDVKTDKYTRYKSTSGFSFFNSDFNDSLAALMKDNEFSSKLNSIKSNQTLVNSIMKELVNPPNEYKEAYGKLQTLYDAYLELTNLVINPTGSLSSYTSSFNNADTATLNAYNAMKIYLDN